MTKTVITSIVLLAILITLVLCFSEDLDKSLRAEYGHHIAAHIHGTITMGTVGILALIYWWINK